MAENKYIFVYQTINKVNGKSYVGVHSTNKIDDGYIGGGIRSQGGAKGKHPFHNAVKKYGYKAFKRHILSFYDTYSEAMEEERYIVDEKWVKSKDNYNRALGGRGYALAYMSKDELSEKFKGSKNHRYGKPAINGKAIIKYSLAMEKLQEYSSIAEAAQENNCDASNVSFCCIGKYGMCNGNIFRYKEYTESEKILLNKNLLKRKRIYNTDGSWGMSKDIQYEKERTGMKGMLHTEESRKKMSLSATGRKRPHSEETKIKIGNANRGKVYSGMQKSAFKKNGMEIGFTFKSALDVC